MLAHSRRSRNIATSSETKAPAFCVLLSSFPTNTLCTTASARQMFGIVVEELGNILKPDSLIVTYSEKIRSAEAEAAGSP